VSAAMRKRSGVIAVLRAPLGIVWNDLIPELCFEKFRERDESIFTET
jgi:hypothetical protein